MYRYVQKKTLGATLLCFNRKRFSDQKRRKSKENAYLRNLKPECQKQSKAIIEINQVKELKLGNYEVQGACI